MSLQSPIPPSNPPSLDEMSEHHILPIESEIAKRLRKELTLSETNRYETDSKWRQILRKEKFQDLVDEIPSLSDYHDQNVQRKKDMIDSIQNEINHLRDMYHEATVANINRVEDLISKHDDQVVLLERDFREKVDLLQRKFEEDRQCITFKYDQDIESVRQGIERLRQMERNQQERQRQEQQHELEDIKNRNLDSINGLRFQLDSKVEDLEQQFEQDHLDFIQSTEFTRSAYDLLKSKEERVRKDLERKTRRADKLQKDIQRFQMIAKQEQAQNEERKRSLLQRKTRAIRRLQANKDEMVAFRKEQQNKLIELSRYANAKKDSLREQCAMAEKVKKLALECQKKETAREEFASLLRVRIDESDSKSSSSDGSISEEPNSNVCASRRMSWQDELKQRASQMSRPSNQENDNNNTQLDTMSGLWDKSHRFWDKYNMAQLDVRTLEKRANSLKQKEEELKAKLKMYNDGTTVNDDVLNERNSLFVVNGKTNVIMASQQSWSGNGRKMRKGVPTVIDGNHIFSTPRSIRS
mmetsp:Transcript_26711/g.56865  ORF Transcript_26711/g.56865 Transcript_26711/m.56865 type:complete len:526 (-) Transcript_26711:81-1658(-)